MRTIRNVLCKNKTIRDSTFVAKYRIYNYVIKLVKENVLKIVNFSNSMYIVIIKAIMQKFVFF